MIAVREANHRASHIAALEHGGNQFNVSGSGANAGGIVLEATSQPLRTSLLGQVVAGCCDPAFVMSCGVMLMG